MEGEVLFGITRYHSRTEKITMTPWTKRYLRDFLIGMSLYVVLLIVAIAILNNLPPHPANALLMLVPVAPILFAFRAFIENVRHMDELQQRIQMEAFAFSLGLTGILTFTYGLLERAGWPDIPMVWVFPLIIFLWGIGLGVASRRFK